MDQTLHREARSGRGSGRGLNRILNSVIPGARHAADGLRRRRPTAARYQTIGAALNQGNTGVPRTSTSIFGTGPNQIDPIVIGGVGGAIGSAVGGVLSATSGKYEGGTTLPGSDYIGPGNTVKAGAARSEADQIAKEHDLAYSDILDIARTKVLSEREFFNLIKRTDSEAQDRFNKEILESGSIPAYVGKYGLKIKGYLEDLYGGALYPQKPTCEYNLSIT